ncbi:MAG: hypothetical protein ACJ71S_06460 [Acidobacteriaceae bacterium]
MSEQMAYLVIDRAPLRGVRYWALLYMAMAANERDITYASGRAVAKAIRVHLQRAQEALLALDGAGYLQRLRYGQPKNRYDGYYLVRRETLLALPSQDALRRSFSGRTVEYRERILTAETAAVLAEQAVILEQFLGLREGEHLPFLKKIAAKNQDFH